MRGETCEWRSDDGSIEFQAPAALLEAIRSEVSIAMLGVAHGGVEIGGLLLGKRSGRRVVVRDWRRIRCDHSLGPSFQLSPHDMTALSVQIDGILSESKRNGNAIVGWFVSHTRGTADLRDEEKRLHRRAMPAHVGLLLALKPNQFGDVEVQFNHAYGEESSVAPGSLHIKPRPELRWAPDREKPVDDEPPIPRVTFPYAAIVGLLLIAGGCGWLGWDLWKRHGVAVAASDGPAKQPEPPPTVVPAQLLSLQVRRSAAAYEISWSTEADVIGTASRATLTFFDGNEARTRVLRPSELKLGHVSHRSAAPSITVRMSVDRPTGRSRVERVTYPAMETSVEIR